MAIPRYQAKNIQVRTGGGRAQRAAAQVITSLADRLMAFKAPALQARQMEGVKEAEQAFMSDGLNARTINESGAYATGYDQRMRQLYNKRVKLDIYDTANKLYQEFPNDPVGFESSFDNYSKKYLANVDPGQQADIALHFASEKSERMAKVNANNLRKTREAELSATNETIAMNRVKIGNFAFEGNLEQSNYMLTKDISDIDEAVANGIYTAEKGRQMKDDHKFNFISNTFYGTMDRYIDKGEFDKAQKVIDDLEGRTTEEFSVEQRQEMLNNMRRNLATGVRQQQAESGNTTRMVHEKAVDAMNALKKGKLPKNMNEVMSLPLNEVDSKDLKEELTIFNDTQRFRYLPPDKQATELNDIRSKVDVTPEELKKMDRFESIHKRTQALVNRSPIDAAVAQGYAKKEEIAPITAFTEEGFKALAGRLKAARKAQNAYGRTPGVLTSAEQKMYADAWPTMDSAQKGTIVAGIAKNLPTDLARATLGQLNKTRADNLVIAGNLMTLGKDGIAREIMQGNQLVGERLKGVTPFDLSPTITNSLGDSISKAGDANTLNGYMDAIRSLYLSRAIRAGKDVTEGVDTDIMDQTVKDVTGGIVEINGGKILAPRHGMDEDDAEDWWDNITIQDIANKYGGIGYKTSPEEIPDIFNLIKEQGQLISVGQGKYRVRVGGMDVLNRSGMPLEIIYGDE